MPVNRGVFGKTIGNIDPDAFTLDRLDRRTS